MQAGRNPEQLGGVFVFGKVLRRGRHAEGLEGGQVGVCGIDVHGHAAYRLKVAELLGQAGRARLVVQVIERELLSGGVGARSAQRRRGETRGSGGRLGRGRGRGRGAVGRPIVLHLGAERRLWRGGGEGVEGLEAVAEGVADEAQGPRVAFHLVFFVVAVHVANCFGDVVIIIADGDLGRMATALLVNALQFTGSVRRLWIRRRAVSICSCIPPPPD